MILVDCPSAAFSKASRLRSLTTVSSALASRIIEIPSAFAFWTSRMAWASPSALRIAASFSVDVTGYGCVNCREMEERVWSDPEVLGLLRDRFEIVALHTDDKARLPEDQWVHTDGGKVLKDVGRVNSEIARRRFGVNSQPSYIILSPDGEQIAPVRSYNLDIEGFREYLRSAL